MNKFFIYTRKSTDDEDRQVLSIEAQIAELREFAKKESLEIIDELIESKTAKYPGRPIFNEMLLKIENGEADGIISWNPDRLARNAVDGGQIINLVDKGKLKSLKFPTYWFEPSSQGLFMLQIAFGQAKYYIDNLSENVKRGIRQKLRRGEWPGMAPLGYLNDLKTRTIIVDKEKALIVVKLFKAYASGKYSFEGLSKLAFSWSIKTRKTKKELSLSFIQRMLQNKFYLGLFLHKGEIYEGKHEPLIDKATFDAVKRIMSQRGKPRKIKTLLNFPFRGLFTCGECGRTITAEKHTKKSGLVFKYYRCTKKNTNCSQKYLSENNLVKQVDKIISKVALSDDWSTKMLKQVKKWEREKDQSSALALKGLNEELEKLETKLSKLLDAHLNGILEIQEYQNKKAELMEKKVALKQKIAHLGKKGNQWLEPLKNWIYEASNANKILFEGNFEAKAELLKKIGSNRLIKSDKALIYLENSRQILAEKSPTSDWYAVRDSNPRPSA